MNFLQHRSRVSSLSPTFDWCRRQSAVLLCLVLIGLASALLPLASVAQTLATQASGEASEERVKAAFLFRFPNYVDWPAASFPKSDSPYVIGVVSDDDIADELLKISAGRVINNRPIIVRKVAVGDALSGIHLLFIGKAERAKLPQVVKQASGQAALIVTDVDGALAQGSMINFRIQDDRVRFDVSVNAAEKSNLKLSSRLLAIALSVIRDAQK